MDIHVLYNSYLIDVVKIADISLLKSMLEIYTWSVFITGIFFTSFGFFLFIRNRNNPVTQRFFILSIFFALWCYSWFLLLLQDSNHGRALFFARLLSLGATFIPIAFLHWVVSILEKEKYHRVIIVTGYTISSLFALFSFSPLYITNVRQIQFFNYWPVAGPLFSLFILVGYVCVIIYALVLLISSIKKSDKEGRYQIAYILIGSLLGFGGGITNFPLMYGVDIIQPIGIFSLMLTPIVFAYATIRYNLMNIKIVAAQLMVGAMVLVFFVNVILSNTSADRFLNIILLIFSLIFGIQLIRSVNREISSRERIEALAGELATSNEKLGTTNAALESTNKQLEVANARLKELDRQKSEFVSIASHQLRSPLTAMKGYSSMLLEGSFGKVPDKARDAIDRIFQSSQRLAIIIDDFLNISRIEQGRMQYEFSTVDIADLVREILKEMEAPIKNAGLTIKYEKADKGPYKVTADYGKIRQVVTNVIDNSIKYTPKGGIVVTLHKDEEGRKIMLEVKDTGIGIEPEVMPLLFQKFSRAEDAGKTNIQGTGLGLFVAKEIMKAHRGNIWVDSEGKDKGSTFYLQFLAE